MLSLVFLTLLEERTVRRERMHAWGFHDPTREVRIRNLGWLGWKDRPEFATETIRFKEDGATFHEADLSFVLTLSSRVVPRWEENTSLPSLTYDSSGSLIEVAFGTNSRAKQDEKTQTITEDCLMAAIGPPIHLPLWFIQVIGMFGASLKPEDGFLVQMSYDVHPRPYLQMFIDKANFAVEDPETALDCLADRLEEICQTDPATLARP